MTNIYKLKINKTLKFHLVPWQPIAQAPLLTCQNRIEVESKNEKMIYAKRLSE